MKSMDISSLVFADLMANLFGIFLVLSALLLGMVRIETAMLIDPPDKGPKKPALVTPGSNTPTLEIRSGQKFVFWFNDKLSREVASITEAKEVLNDMQPAALVLKIDSDVSTGVTRQLMVLCQDLGTRMFWGAEARKVKP